jgi:glycosyltransferase involved in cell wall biosynthesis
MRRKRIAIIGTNGIPPKYGGFETLVGNLVQNLKDEFAFIIYCSKIHKYKQRYDDKNIKTVYFPLFANGWQSILYDTLSIIHAFFCADTLLILGPISAGFILSLNKIFKKRIVTNYGGIEWKRDKIIKIGQKFAYFNYKVAISNSNVHVVDNDAIGIELQNDFHIDSFEIIAYGGDHVSPVDNYEHLLVKYPFLNEKYFLSVGRSQIDNNQHLLLETFFQMKDKKLVIIANWEFNEYGRELKKKYAGTENIVILDAIYEQNILDTIRANCDVYIHSQSQCGTAPSLVEAMTLNLPIISYNVPTNRATTDNKSLYFSTSEELINIISSLNDKEKQKIREAMGKIAKERYTWKIVAEQYGLTF